MIQRYAYKLRAIMKDAVSTNRPCSRHPSEACALCSPQPSSAHPSWAPRWDLGCGCQAGGEWEGAGIGPVRSLPSCSGAATESWASLSWPLSLLQYPSRALSPFPHQGGEDTAPPACRHLLAPSGVLEDVEQSYSNFKSCLMMFLYIILVYRTYSFLLCIKQ